MADISSLLGLDTGYQSQSDLLVSAYKRQQQPKINTLLSKQRDLESRKSFFNNLNSKLNSLISKIDDFTADNAADDFVTRKITSSNNSVLTVSANSNATLGISSVFVERLATNDNLISSRLNLSDSFGEAAGSKSFDLIIGGETHSISVEIDGTETNEEAMKKIVNAINNTDDIDVSAAFIKDTSTTGRLTITSQDTGSENKISFSDSSVLSRLGFSTAALNPDTNARTIASDTAAGYQTADYADLDAKLDVNGISVVRSSNTIDDLLSGVTINLLKAQETGDQAVTLTTTVGKDEVKSLIKPLLDSYNELLDFLKSNKDTARKDVGVSTLYSDIRLLASDAVTGLEDGAPKMLTEIGIEIGSDGKLKISDEEELEDILKEDPQQVANLFVSADGFANKLQNAISNLTGDNGLIKSRTLSLGDQIDNTIERKEELEARIDQQAQALRKEYENTLQVFLEAQAQYQFLGTYASSGSSGGGGLSYNSLLY